MGLDIYVGSFTRYYTGEWETLLQRLSREGQIPPVQIDRPNPPSQGLFRRLVDRLRPKGVEASARAVRRWQKQLQRDLNVPDLDWNEDPGGEYFTDKPGWYSYGALVLWAAYQELPYAKRRETAEGWDKDSACLTIRMNRQSRYRHLAADTEIWLPVDLTDPIRTKSLTGDSVMLGSSVRLLAELRQLNARTWSVDDSQISEWRYIGEKDGGPLDISARFAFSIFYELARQSAERRLPMKLDY